MVKKVGTKLPDNLQGTSGDDLLKGKGGNDILDGLGGNDKLVGGGGNDTLIGGAGDDILVGNRGDDIMIGGAGADQFRGGKGIDTADYSSSTTQVLAYLSANTSGFGASGDTFILMENVIGSAFDDFLQSGKGGDAFGGAGADKLFGGGTLNSTEDGGRLRGDAGIDTLNMNYGATQAWLQNGQGYDVIKDFVEGSDMFFIDLSDFGLGDTLDANEVVSNAGGTAVGTHAQFIFNQTTHNLYFDANGTNAGGLSLVAQLDNATLDFNNIGVNDFVYQL
jgi:Ca2+-binding RTX toxin-like protein